MEWALNQMTTPNLSYQEFLVLARSLNCVGVEVRNDLKRPLFDGLVPAEAGRIAQNEGLRLVGLSQVYPFNIWSPAIKREVQELIAVAKAAGAETISLIPRNEGLDTNEVERKAHLAEALREILPLLEDADMTALVEPLGFRRSSLRNKSELVSEINALGASHRYKLVHDTFHHVLADGGAIIPENTGIVHISAVTDPSLRTDQMEDEHRVLVGADDRLDNVGQIAALLAAGYKGPISYECFSPLVHEVKDPYQDIKASMVFIEAGVAANAAA